MVCVNNIVSASDLCDEVYVDSLTRSVRCYVVVHTSLTWQEARSACEALNGHLVTIESQEENDVMRKLKFSKFYKVLQILRTD